MTKLLRRPVTFCALLGCLAFVVCAFVANGPAWAVQRIDFSSLSSDQLLATDSIRTSQQDVQIIGDRLVIRLQQRNPTGGYYQWQVVYRAVTTFQREATSQHDIISEEAVQEETDQQDWRDNTYWRRRWEEHRNQVRGVGLTDGEG
jgi:hypothetical protein